MPNDALLPDRTPTPQNSDSDASIADPAEAGTGENETDPSDANSSDVTSSPDAASPSDGGSITNLPTDGGAPGVVLRAVVAELFPDGTESIAAEWHNGTSAPIFLRGCATADGSYFDGAGWQLYGSFATCAMETPMVEVPAGEIYLDPVSGAVPDRGTNRWRLSGPYGVGCRPAGALLGEAECEGVFELISANEFSWNP